MCKKNIKKGFFVNNKKYLLYLVLMGIFCTFCNCITATSSAEQTALEKSTATKKTTPQKKENSKKKTTNNKTQSTPKVTENPSCPHADTPVEYLNSAELEEVLACTQAKVEKIENLIEVVEKEEKLHPAKKRKTGLINRLADAPRCPYATTPLKKLKAEQLEEVYAYTQTHKMDGAFTVDLLERLIALSDNHAGVKRYKLELADTHYALHHIEKAAACYEDFGVLYPGSKENEYVLYKAVVCMFELSLDADRDQTNSKKTIILVKEFLKHAKSPDLIDEANAILQKCYDRLYGHEVYIFNFYTKKKSFVAAQMRLDFIAKTFTETIKDLDTKVAELQAQLELKKNPVKPTRKALLNRFLA